MAHRCDSESCIGIKKIEVLQENLNFEEFL